ncbi:hypothetical protein AM500_04210 [Bacillus sp. FJAT-18017]|uniref:hypothetical protein n=1 Tax=Bacillus sp. FJAT-18017 TaxID=1705566 RepID=UPI0006AFAB1F|nr:hypothetical protein [Bacillus sp. FJAT-18017]ALC89084.1 hypothetical protein AM500_04210 [Bacillus sp. FJAT-18017]
MNNTRFYLNIFLYFIFVLSTLAVFFIIYKNIDTPFAADMVLGYVIFLFAFAMYLTITAALQLRKTPKTELRKRTIKFALLFILFFAANSIFDLLFKPESSGLIGNIFPALGFALGLTFLDTVFTRKE